VRRSVALDAAGRRLGAATTSLVDELEAGR